MRRLWKIRKIPVFLVICLGSGAAQSAPDLPSAPSATRQEKAAPPKTAPTPTATDQTSAPAVKAGESAAGSTGKDKPEADDPGRITIPVTVNEVNVVFTVTDRHNRYVQDLVKGDFKVIDDERPVGVIRSFRRETDLPLQVGLLIDASNSIRDRFKFEQESAIEFLNDTIRRKYDQAFVIGFDEKPELTQDLTDNMEALSKGVRMLHPGGGTALYDALYYASRDKFLQSAQSDSVRRAIILVTDGDDNASHRPPEEPIQLAPRATLFAY